jgi:DNA (cytosine-5)-methyltransferase 1
VGENVFGLINWNDGLVFDEVQADLEAEGYEVQPYVLPAVAVNAPHRRDRVWFVAYADKWGRRERVKFKHNNSRKRQVCKDITDDRNKIWSKSWNGSSDRITPDTSSIGCDNRGDNGQERHISGNQWTTEEGQSERKGRECGIGTSCKITTDPNCNGLDERNVNDEVNAGQRGEYAQRDVDQVTMHTDSTSESGQYIGSTREGQFDRPNSRDEHIGNWQNFPTQPPICGGNDGLPTELHGITFPKWRAESIKAYGNAIVPQVAMQIFKAIQQYEQL